MRRFAIVCLTSLIPVFGQAAEHTPPAEDGNLDCLIEPLRVVQIGSRADGVLEEVLVDRGDTVSRGQLLAALDSQPERAALELARQRAREDVALRSSRVKFEFGQRRAARFSDTYLAEAATDLERDEASTAARLARLGVAEAQANRIIANLEVARVEALLQQRRITSPLDGVVVERLMNPGERVTDGPILTLAQIDPLKVEVIVPVAMLGKMRIGSRAVVLPEAPVTGEYPAAVTVVDRVVDARSGTFGVRLELANPDHALPGGLRCQVRFLADDEAPAAAADRPAAEMAAPPPPAVEPLPRSDSPDDSPTLRSAEAGAPVPTASAIVSPAITPAATVSATPPPTTATTQAFAQGTTPESTTASTLGNLLLPTATASAIDRDAADQAVGNVAGVDEVAASAAAGERTAVAEIASVAPAVADADPVVLDQVAEVATQAVTPPAAPRDEKAEKALLAALPPLPELPPLVLDASMFKPTPVAVTEADATAAPSPSSTPAPAPSSRLALAAQSSIDEDESEEEPAAARAAHGRAATASGRLRAAQGAGRAASREPAVRTVGQCLALGPIADADHAARVVERARAVGWSAHVNTREDRSTRKRVLTVAVLDGGVEATGAALQARGFHDLSYLASGPFEGNWSAGVFSNMAFAEERRGALAAAGFQADLHPFGRTQLQHWVQIDGAVDDDELASRLDSPASASVHACD